MPASIYRSEEPRIRQVYRRAYLSLKNQPIAVWEAQTVERACGGMLQRVTPTRDDLSEDVKSRGKTRFRETRR